jgi:hypothetical protein
MTNIISVQSGHGMLLQRMSLKFRINQLEQIITYKSQQITGPDNLSDFGKIRHCLNDIRTRTKVILQPIGSRVLLTEDEMNKTIET